MKEKDINIVKTANEVIGLNMDIVHSKDQIENMFKTMCEDIWTRRGAKFGKVQTMHDIDLDFENRGWNYNGYLPERLKNGEPFLTTGISIQGDVSGADCILWVKPIKKNGEPSKLEFKFLRIPIETWWDVNTDEDV